MGEYEIAAAVEGDVDQILDRLIAEYDAEAGIGFYGNRDMIRRGVGEDLWVAREGGQVLGFLLGRYAPDILWVDPEHRCQGIGPALFATSLDRAFEDNVNAMDIQCKPEESYGFWVKHGFTRFGSSSPWEPICARRMLPRTLETPGDLPSVPVKITFYPENALYGEGVQPTVKAELAGRMDHDGNVWLPERVISLIGGGNERDQAVRIEVDGQQLYFDKAKYNEAKALGVEKDRQGGTFYIDRIPTQLSNLVR